MAHVTVSNYFDHVTSLLSDYKNPAKQKYRIYLAHDHNIVSGAYLLGVKPLKHYPYLSNIRFELFENAESAEPLVQTSLNREPVQILNKTLVPLNEFVGYIKKVLDLANANKITS